MNDQKSDWGPLFWGIVWSAFVLLVAGRVIYDGHGQWLAWLGAVFILLLMGPPYFFIVFCCCFPALSDKYNKQIAVVFGIWMALLVIGPLLIFWPVTLMMALMGVIFVVWPKREKNIKGNVTKPDKPLPF